MWSGALLIAVLGMFTLQGPSPWGGLWLLVPAAVATALLVSWRFGAWGVLVPVGLFVVVFAVEGPFSLWAWWIPVAALTGCWMGLGEEGGGPGSGRRAWMTLPVLLLAALVPWMVNYPEFVDHVDRRLEESNREGIAQMRDMGLSEHQIESMEKAIAEGAPARTRMLPNALPSFLFLWVVVLVGAGRALASRLGRVMGWPSLTRARFRDWRLPDGAVWLFLAGLALLMTPWPSWAPTGWTLLINSGLAYCVQGVAVVESLLLARGVPPSIVLLTMLFVFTVALPVFLLTTAALGISDVWLDYRRLEASPNGDPVP